MGKRRTGLIVAGVLVGAGAVIGARMESGQVSAAGAELEAQLRREGTKVAVGQMAARTCTMATLPRFTIAPDSVDYLRRSAAQREVEVGPVEASSDGVAAKIRDVHLEESADGIMHLAVAGTEEGPATAKAEICRAAGKSAITITVTLGREVSVDDFVLGIPPAAPTPTA